MNSSYCLSCAIAAGWYLKQMEEEMKCTNNCGIGFYASMLSGRCEGESKISSNRDRSLIFPEMMDFVGVLLPFLSFL
jgi:hypothetical protein